MITIGEKLQTKRKEKNYTQDWVAKKLQISTGTLSLIEQGKLDITLTRFYELCSVLEVKAHEMLPSNPKDYTPPEIN